MDIELNSIRKNLLGEERLIQALKDALIICKKNATVCQKLWDSEYIGIWQDFFTMSPI